MGAESEAERPEPSESPTAGSASFWTRVQEHKILQWTLAYAGAALAIAHGQELMASAYGWPHTVGKAVMTLLVLGLPLVVTLAWYHGHKGLKQVAAGELMIVAVLLVILAGGFFVLVRAPAGDHETSAQAVGGAAAPTARRSEPAPAAAALSPGRGTTPRIAIMPFENLSPDPNNAFFTDGIHEQILSTLANRAPDLEVVSRTTMMSYRGRPVTVQDVAGTLAATHVLEGSVRREGEQVRLTLQLIDARTDRHLWSEDYDRTLTNALSLQSEIAAAVASRLSVEVRGGGARADLPTKDPEAYDLYLKARLKFPLIGSPKAEFDETIALLDAAIARDPEFTRAYLERMYKHVTLFGGNHDATQARLDLARSDLEAAVRLAPEDPAVVWAQGTWNCINENYDLALEQFARAEAAGLSDVDNYGTFCFAVLGRYDDARRMFERAIALDPRNPVLLVFYGTSASNARRPSDTRRVLELAAARVPDYPIWPFLRAIFRARFEGRTEEWYALPEWVVTTLPPFDASYLVVLSLTDQGRYDDALEALATLPELTRNFSETRRGVGMTPTTHFRGWLNWLRNDAAAAQDGRALVEFVRRQPVTRWNEWYLRILDAEGRLFANDPDRARASAREAIEIASRSRNLMYRAGAKSMAAKVLAAAGAEEEAAVLLEELSASSPGLSPGEITKDPVLRGRLADNARYRALTARLEAQMAAFRVD